MSLMQFLVSVINKKIKKKKIHNLNTNFNEKIKFTYLFNKNFLNNNN